MDADVCPLMAIRLYLNYLKKWTLKTSSISYYLCLKLSTYASIHWPQNVNDLQSDNKLTLL